jgi:hypothetical protein
MRHRCYRFCAIVLAALLVVPYTHAHAGPRLGASKRVRTSDPEVSTMVEAGYRRSPTFRRIVDAIERSNVIVYIERRILASRGAAMHFVTLAGGYRYVRVTLDAELARDPAVALLGHELQHAAEVAAASWVIDLRTLADLYDRIGHQASCPAPRRCFDTAAAVTAGRLVLHELHAERETAGD